MAKEPNPPPSQRSELLKDSVSPKPTAIRKPPPPPPPPPKKKD